MTVAQRIEDALREYDAGRYQQSLVFASIAVDATSAAEYNHKGRASYKRFVRENFRSITQIAFKGPSVQNLRLQWTFKDAKLDPNGLVDVGEIMYHVVRCGLLHDGKLPENMDFTTDQAISLRDDRLLLPASLSLGLAIACVLSPINADQSIESPLAVNLHQLGLAFPINLLWGRRDAFSWLLDVRNDIHRIPDQVEAPSD